MTYKNVTTQNYGPTVFEFTTDDGIKGVIGIEKIPEDKMKAHPHLIDMVDANTIIQYPEGKYTQKSRLSKALLTDQEADAIRLLIQGNHDAYKKAMKTPAPTP